MLKEMIEYTIRHWEYLHNLNLEGMIDGKRTAVDLQHLHRAYWQIIV